MIADAIVNKARAVLIEHELARRGLPFWLKARHNNLGAPCPMCGGRDRFSVSAKKQIWNCRGCGEAGDVIALVRHLDRVDFPKAVETLAGVAPDRHGRPARYIHSAPPKRAASEPDDGQAIALRTWTESRPIAGTLGERYLREHRRLALDEDLSHCVRFHALTPWQDGDDLLRVPCLIAVYRSVDGDEIVAIQKTRLAPDGSKIGRKMRGPVKDAAIKIDRDEEVTYGVTVGEGLETVLSARALGFRPAWALGSAGAIETFPVLAGIDALTILAETGARSESAVKTCGARWRGAGREVIVTRSRFGSDINDAIREAPR
jgi:hypothetical protein